MVQRDICVEMDANEIIQIIAMTEDEHATLNTDSLLGDKTVDEVEQEVLSEDDDTESIESDSDTSVYSDNGDTETIASDSDASVRSDNDDDSDDDDGSDDDLPNYEAEVARKYAHLLQFHSIPWFRRQIERAEAELQRYYNSRELYLQWEISIPSNDRLIQIKETRLDALNMRLQELIQQKAEEDAALEALHQVMLQALIKLNHMYKAFSSMFLLRSPL